MHYLLTASVLLFLVTPAYFLLLRYSDHYAVNRWLLLIGLAVLCLLPRVELPSPAPVASAALQDGVTYLEKTVQPATSVSLTTELRELPRVADQPAAAPVLKDKPFGVGALPLLYLLVAGGFGLLFLFRVYRLLSLHLRSRPSCTDVKYRLLPGDSESGQAFTFLRTVYLSPDVANSADRDLILAHERIHARQLHSVDILLSELFLCVFWFHPCAWWLRAQLRANLEYLVDAAVVRRMDKRDYQLALVRQEAAAYGLALALPFSEPSLRQRVERLGRMPRPWLRTILTTAAVLVWIGSVAVVVAGNTASSVAFPPQGDCVQMDCVHPKFAAYRSHFARVIPGRINSLRVYFQRLPTYEEYVQLKAIVSRIPGTGISAYPSCQLPGQYALQLGHGLNPEAVIQAVPVEKNGTDFYLLALSPNNTAQPSPRGKGLFTPQYGHFRSQPGTSIRDAATTELVASSGLPSATAGLPPADFGSEDILLYVNGEQIALDQSVRTPIPALPAKLKLPPNARMRCLLDKDGLYYRRVMWNRPGEHLNYFNLLQLPVDRPVKFYYNDVEATREKVLRTDFGRHNMIQVAYRPEVPGEPIIVQVIDDMPW